MELHRGKPLYPYVLDHKPGFFLGWFLYRLFQRVNLEENMKTTLKEMHKEGTIVYATKYRDHLNYLLYHYNFRKKRLPFPKIAFDLNIFLFLPLSKLFKIIISQVNSFFKYGRLPSPYQSGFYKKAVREGTPSLMSLVDPKGFIRQFIYSEKDHLHFLLEIQRTMDRPIFIVPQLILYKKTPEKDYSNLSNIFFGYKDHPGLIRKTVLFFRHHRQAIIDFGRPLNLREYLKDQSPERPLKDISAEVRQMLIESIDRQKRVILGPIMKSRQQFKEVVLMDQGVLAKIEEMAAGDGKKIKQLKKKAGEYFDEIAADYNITYIHLFRIALNWLWKKIFEGIDVDPVGQAIVREWARKGPMIYVPSHKSHIDYLVLNYVLHDYHLHIPRIAAGQNLAFWPMGHIFRKSGAFFIRRSFKGAKLYSEVFTRYIMALLEDGHPIEFYIEGGRSRNGKLVLPKTGFLSILLKAYEEGFCKDLIFVPTSIIYDRIMEGGSYLREVKGGVKEQENLKQMLRASRFLKQRYGKIYIRFNTPFSLNEYLSQKDGVAKDPSRELAFHLIRAINDVSLVTPLSLMATVILANHRKGFHASELLETLKVLLEFLQGKGALLAATLTDPARAAKDTISLLINWKFLEFIEDLEGEPFYFVDDDKKMELEYYKNSIIHFFIHHSLVAISLLTGTQEAKRTESIISDYSFLKDLLKNEFVFESEEDIPGKINSIITFFLDAGLLTWSAENSGYKITKMGFDRLPIWAELAKTFIESCWIAAKAVSQRKGRRRREDILKNMGELGQRFYKLEIIDHIGALSRINFINALNAINKNTSNAKEGSSEDHSSPADSLSRLSKRLYELSHYS